MVPSPRIARSSLRAPRRLRALLGCRRPVVIDGQTLDADVQWMLHLSRLMNVPPLTGPSLAAMRRNYRQVAPLLAPRIACPTAVRVIDGAAGKLGARLYRPSGAHGLLIYFHGGGWVIGDLETHDPVLRALAVHARCQILSVDYRLAPEHVFPAAADDAYAAFCWAVAHADELGVSPTRIAVGGDSAGGNLAAGVSQRARADAVGPCLQLLLYPGLDLVEETPSATMFADGFPLRRADVRWFKQRYAPDCSQWKSPLASPARAEDLSGLAPACVVTAGFDPLRDEGLSYAARLSEAGVPTEARCFSSLPHGFLHMAGDVVEARVALAYIGDVLRRGLR